MRKQLDKSKFIKTPHHPNEEALKCCVSRNPFCPVDTYRTILSNLSIGEYIETGDFEIWRFGKVDQIMRDRWGIPVCARVIYENDDGTWGYDMVPLNEIEIPEGYDNGECE